MSTPITFTAYIKENLCYKTNKRMPSGSPVGIIIHSTGANNPNLLQYVDHPTITQLSDGNYAYSAEL